MPRFEIPAPVPPVIVEDDAGLSEEEEEGLGLLVCRMLDPAGSGGLAFFRDLSVLIDGEVARREAREWVDGAGL